MSPDSNPLPLTGGYYWLPTPSLRSFQWRVVTCHDMGFDEDVSHFDIWPKVVTDFARLWGRDPKVLRRRLDKHCYGFPRGRVTRPEKTLLILHGNDSPISDWKQQVILRFNLHGKRIRVLFDEHEQTLPADVKAVRRALGGWRRPIGSSTACRRKPRRWRCHSDFPSGGHYPRARSGFRQ